MKEWNVNMRRALIISLLALSMLLVGIAVGMRAVVYASGAEEFFIRVTKYYSETEGGRIYAEHVKNAYYLFLPNEADEKHVVIRTEEQGETIHFVLDGVETDEIDLSTVRKLGGKWTVKVVVRDSGGKTVEDLTMSIMKGPGIGTVYYNSDNPEDYGRSWIERKKENRSSGNAIVFDAEGNNLTKDAKNQVIEDFHGRGAATWEEAKKSYQMKFDKKISLIEGTSKEKKWLLLAQHVDPIHISDVTCKRIAHATRSDYSPQATWVNFYYDGEYRGVYELSEKNEIKSGRIDINDLEKEYEEQDPEYGNHLDLKKDKNKYGHIYQYQDGLKGPEEPGGFLIEFESVGYTENNGFLYSAGGAEHPMNVKSPDLGSKEFVKYVSEYFQEFCDAVEAVDENGVHTGKNPKTGKYYYEYCDFDSLVDTYLLQTVVSNADAFERSQYFYKDRGAIMISGPMWDMDRSLGTGIGGSNVAERDILASRKISRDLIQIKEFRREVAARYLKLYSKVLESVVYTGEIIPTYKQTFLDIEEPLAMDKVLWPQEFADGDREYTFSGGTDHRIIMEWHFDWLKRHKAFLDDYFRQIAADEEEEHQYGPASAVTATTHQKACVNHPDVVITEDCTFETVSNGDGTHTRKCTQCENKKTEPCSMNYVDNGDGTHTGKCSECGYQKVESHTWGNGNVISRATTAKTGAIEYICKICGVAKQEEIPEVKQADITINVGTITAASVKKIIEKVDAAGGATNAVILGKKVKKISKGAFKKTGIKTVTLKTVSLKDKSVKGSLTGSTVSSVKVKVGGAGKNKKYVKQYKKIFTKKNAGRKVKVS